MKQIFFSLILSFLLACNHSVMTKAPQAKMTPAPAIEDVKKTTRRQKTETKDPAKNNHAAATDDTLDFLKLSLRARIVWIKKSIEDDAELLIQFESEPEGVLMVKPWMSSMAEPHGGKYNCFKNGSTDCKITAEVGTDGKIRPALYRVKGISFPMKGKWDLIFILKKSADPESERLDEATLAVEI